MRYHYKIVNKFNPTDVPVDSRTFDGFVGTEMKATALKLGESALALGDYEINGYHLVVYSVGDDNITNEEKIKVIAQCDDWLIIPEGTYRECHNQTTWFGHGGKFDCYHDITDINSLKYLTSMDWLHPVAMKVLDELTTPDRGDLPSEFWNIVNSCHLKPVNGEYVALFNAVYRGIVFIANNK